MAQNCHVNSSFDIFLFSILFLKVTSYQLKFGYRLVADPFRNYPIVSTDGCMLECNIRSRCKAFVFDRRSRYCMLVDVDSEIGIGEVLDPKIVYSEKKWWTEQSVSPLCSTCDDIHVCRKQICQIEECDSELQSYKGQTAVLGNMVYKLSKIMYVFLCFELDSGQYKTYTIPGECDENGNWNVAQITCHSLYDLIYSIGCYRDFSYRVLRGAVRHYGRMTIPWCASFCYNKGFGIIGMQNSRECFCGNSFRVALRYNRCTMRCSGDRTTYCGGRWALSVYKFK